jgi:uncharacterized membrane protein YkvA (DUF1232 family)
MKSPSGAIELLVSASEPWGKTSLAAWELLGKPLTIDEFIEDRRQYLNSIDLRGLGTFSDRLLDKLERIDSEAYPGLREAVIVMVRIVESPAAKKAEDPLPHWLAEIAFAGSYLLKEMDVIPDHVPEIGLADDALILRRVIERNESELQLILTACSDEVAVVDRRKKSEADRNEKVLRRVGS